MIRKILKARHLVAFAIASAICDSCGASSTGGLPVNSAPAVVRATSTQLMDAASSGDLILWDGKCENGWQLWTSNGTCPGASGPSYNGEASFGISPTYPGGGFGWDHPPFSTTPYSTISFAVNGGTSGGHLLTITGTRSDGSVTAPYSLPALVSGQWQTVSVPLTSLGLDQIPDVHHFDVRDISATSGQTTTFYVTNFEILARPAPLAVTVSIDASTVVNAIDARTAGVNTAVWDPNLASAQDTTAVLGSVSAGSLRFPGGSTADQYHWATNTAEGGYGELGSSGKVFAAVNEARGSAAYITVNYGSGTPQEAAAWVAWANGLPSSTQSLGIDSKGTDWKTVGYWASLRAAAPLATDDGHNVLRAGHPASYAWKYYEIGNENFGGWEYDRHGVSGSGLSGAANDPATYGAAAAAFITQMKMVDPTIKVGAVVSVGRVQAGGNADDSCDAVCNPAEAVPSVAGGSHYGWTPVVLYTMSQAGVRPDFVTYHFYPIYSGLENDTLVLGTPLVLPTWGARLRSQIANYWTGSGGATIELAEGEANLGGSGKETTSLVDGLFYADNYGQMLTAGFVAGEWWALHNIEYTDGNMSASLYGSKLYGCEGISSDGNSPAGVVVPPTGTLFPAGQVFAQLAPFRAAGAVLVKTSSSDPALAAYASKQSDGKLIVLVINKNPTATITGAFSLAGVPFKIGTVGVSTYGKTEDAAGAGPTIRSSLTLGNALVYSFAPYSSTLLTLSP